MLLKLWKIGKNSPKLGEKWEKTCFYSFLTPVELPKLKNWNRFQSFAVTILFENATKITQNWEQHSEPNNRIRLTDQHFFNCVVSLNQILSIVCHSDSNFMKVLWKSTKWNRIIVNFNTQILLQVIPIFLIKIDDSAKHKVICRNAKLTLNLQLILKSWS